jgi:hypothetical protein
MISGRPRRAAFLTLGPLLFLGVILSARCRPATDQAAWGRAYDYDADETFRIDRDGHGFPLVPGRINGRDVKVFFDTGNFFGFLIGPSLAGSLRLPATGSERKNYASDGTFRYIQKGVRAEGFAVFGISLAGVEMYEMTDDAFDASVGVQPLLNDRFTLDLANNLMGVSGRPGGQAEDRDPGLEIVWNDALRGMIVVHGRVNGVETLIQIDTGKSRTTIDETLIALAGLRENNTPALRGYRVERLELGGRTFSVACAKVANFRGISQGYAEPILVGIGADILSQVVLTVDYPRRRVFLR